jgi:NAD(P)-dependent dehydrogenase (short-subunit alcohol dehydrogenase family)
MKERRWGRILYTSSIMALASTGDRVAYSTTKAALHGMVKANALHLGPHGITVNWLAPGPFATEMPMTILSDEQKQRFAARTAVGRWGQPVELAPTALLLASDAGAYSPAACWWWTAGDHPHVLRHLANLEIDSIIA